MLKIRVVTRYMGSGISGFFRGGIRDYNPGIWDHNRGIGISSVFVESGIKILNVLGIRDQNSQRF